MATTPGGVKVSAVSTFPILLDPTNDALPIESYMLSPAQEQVLLTAQQHLITKCMSRYGFSYDVTETSSGEAIGGSVTARRYGVVNMAEVERFGYHPPETGPSRAGNPSMGAAEVEVLTGGDAPTSVGPPPVQQGNSLVVAGRAVPEGGCLAESQRELLANGGAMGNVSLVEQLKFDSYQQSMSNGQVVAAFSAWSKCMKTNGYSYSNPMQAAADLRWNTPAPLPAEKAVAEADVSCKRNTNVVGIWFTIESDIEKVQISQNAKQLSVTQQGINAEMVIADNAAIK